MFNKCQCWPHIETTHIIYCANQLAGFYMRATLVFNGLIMPLVCFDTMSAALQSNFACPSLVDFKFFVPSRQF